MVEVHKEPGGAAVWPLENCCVCRMPTSYWFGTGSLNVALCQACAIRAETATLPTKKEWCERERKLMKQPSFAAPY